MREAQRVLKSRSLLINGVWRTLKKGDRLSVKATIEVPDYQSPGKQRPIANKKALPLILAKGKEVYWSAFYYALNKNVFYFYIQNLKIYLH